MLEKTKHGRRYTRKVDFHKLEEKDVDDRFSYFYRHCGSTRKCVKLCKDDSSRYDLYGYHGSGLQKAHTDWTSLVVRSRCKYLTARLLSILSENFLPRDAFVDAVPENCKCSFEDCLQQLNRALAVHQRNIEGLMFDSSKCESDDEDSCSEESSEPSVAMGDDVDPFDCSKEGDEEE